MGHETQSPTAEYVASPDEVEEGERAPTPKEQPQPEEAPRAKEPSGFHFWAPGGFPILFLEPLGADLGPERAFRCILGKLLINICQLLSFFEVFWGYFFLAFSGRCSDAFLYSCFGLRAENAPKPFVSKKQRHLMSFQSCFRRPRDRSGAKSVSKTCSKNAFPKRETN